MPVIFVHGLRGNPERARTFREVLKKVVAEVQILDVTERQVTVYLLTEFAPPDPGDIVIEIRGIFVKPERTLQVQNQLAEAILAAVEGFLSDGAQDRPVRSGQRLIEVFIYPFDPQCQGFASNKPAAGEQPS
jgi:hypothetical protein